MNGNRLILLLRAISVLLDLCLPATLALDLLHIGDRWRLPPFSTAYGLWAFYQALLLLVLPRELARRVLPGYLPSRLYGWIWLLCGVTSIAIGLSSLHRGHGSP